MIWTLNYGTHKTVHTGRTALGVKDGDREKVLLAHRAKG